MNPSVRGKTKQRIVNIVTLWTAQPGLMAHNRHGRRFLAKCFRLIARRA